MLRSMSLLIFIILMGLISLADSLIAQPNPPVSPLFATPTRALIPTATPLPTLIPLPLPTVANYFQSIKIKPRCTPTAAYQRCYDPILDLLFEYPEAWGTINGTLGSAVDAPSDSGAAGYIYSYEFSYRFTESQLNGLTTIIANGISHDFSRPTDGPVYGLGSFNGRSTSEFCQIFSYPNSCLVIKPGVVVVFLFPPAVHFCELGFMIPPPTGFIYIDLPDWRLISGFMFAYPLLSLAEEKSLYGILGIGPGMVPTKCSDPQAQAQFDQEVSKLADAIAAGTANDGIIQRVNGLTRLANSIQGQESSR